MVRLRSRTIPRYPLTPTRPHTHTHAHTHARTVISAANSCFNRVFHPSTSSGLARTHCGSLALVATAAIFNLINFAQMWRTSVKIQVILFFSVMSERFQVLQFQANLKEI